MPTTINPAVSKKIEPKIEKDPKDHLTPIPPELHHEILSYLFATHTPSIPSGPVIPQPPAYSPTFHQYHDFDALAATSRALRAEVMTWARLFLGRHRAITNHDAEMWERIDEVLSARSQQNALRGAFGLFGWADRHCVFCGKWGGRKAVLMNGINCCKVCDDREWPGKIEMKEAMKEFELTEHQLLPHEHECGKLLVRHPGGLPQLRYGRFKSDKSSNTITTMFLKPEVTALATLTHGDLKEHFAKREAAREERRLKCEAKKAAQAAKEAREAAELVTYEANAKEVIDSFLHLQGETTEEERLGVYAEAINYYEEVNAGAHAGPSVGEECEGGFMEMMRMIEQEQEHVFQGMGVHRGSYWGVEGL